MENRNYIPPQAEVYFIETEQVCNNISDMEENNMFNEG